METGKDTSMKKKNRLSYDAYVKSYSPLIKYFINLRLSKCRSYYIKNNREDVYQEVCFIIWRMMEEKPEIILTSETLRQYVNWQINRMERKEYKSPINHYQDLSKLTNIPISTDIEEEDTYEFYDDCLEFVEKNFSDTNKQIFYLRYHMGLAFKEIDKRLDVSEGNSRKKYSRFMKDVRQYAEEHRTIDSLHPTEAIT